MVGAAAGGQPAGGRDRGRARRPGPEVRPRRSAPAQHVRPPGGGRHRPRPAARQRSGGGPTSSGPCSTRWPTSPAELELSRVLQAVLQRAVTLLGVTGGEVAIYRRGARSELVVVASQNIGKDSTGTRLGARAKGAMGRVAQTHEPLIIPSLPASGWGRSATVRRSHGALGDGRAAPDRPTPGGRDRQRPLRPVPRASAPTTCAGSTVRAPGGDRHRERAALYRGAAAASVLPRTWSLNSPVAIVTLDREHRHRLLQSRLRALFGFPQARRWAGTSTS